MALKHNTVMVHEPTFYQGQDDTSQLEGDDVLAIKRDYIEKHGLVVWRFHDHLHRMEPDGIVTGMVKALGWEAYRHEGESILFDFEPTTLRSFAKDVKRRLHADSLRVVGAADLEFSKVALEVGAPYSVAQIRLL